MNASSLFRVEFGRLMRNRLAWLAAALTALAPIAGYSFYHPTFGDSMGALYLANPMLTGGMAGTLLFALLILAALDQPARSGTAALIETIIPPVKMHAIRLLAVLSLAVLTSLAVGILYLPYTMWKLNIVFSFLDYWLAVLLFLLSGPVMGTLAAAMAIQITGRLDVSVLALLAAVIFSRSRWCSQYFLAHWNIPLVSTLSDAFGSAVVWRTAFYSRLVWLCLLGGGWLLSLLCVRQYGKGAAGSLIHRIKRPVLPISSILLLLLGAVLWNRQPFIDHCPEDWISMETADRFHEHLTTESTSLNVTIDSFLMGTLSGEASWQIRNNSGSPQELYFNLNSGYRVRSITANGEPLPFEDLKNDYIASRELRCTLPADEEISLVITYGGMPRIWNAQERELSGNYISSRGIYLASHHLAPTVAGCAPVEDEDTPVTLTITLPAAMTPVSTGSPKQLSDNRDGTVSWVITDQGTDRIQLFAGDYVYKELATGSGMPIQFYYSKKYQSRLENGALELMEQAIAYCTSHYGPRSFTEDKPFKIVQLTAFQFGGFANRSISGMGETYFSDENLNNPDKGPASAEVLAHEIIHQWWGLGATLYDPEDEDWNDEGITVYTTYRLMSEIMGEDYARENYTNKWKAVMKDQHASFYQRHPEYLDRLPKRYSNEILASRSSSNWYDGNALMIYRAAEKTGPQKIDEIWSELYTRQASGLSDMITLTDFLDACGLKKGEVERE